MTDPNSIESGQQFKVIAYIPDESEFDRRANVSVNGKEIVDGSIDHDVVRDVEARPDAYVADTNAVRVELFILPQGWNEGFENVRQPILTYFLPTLSDSAQVIEAVEQDRDAWMQANGQIWTSVEARIAPASSQAKMNTPEEVIEAFKTWAMSGDIEHYIP